MLVCDYLESLLPSNLSLLSLLTCPFSGKVLGGQRYIHCFSRGPFCHSMHPNIEKCVDNWSHCWWPADLLSELSATAQCWEKKKSWHFNQHAFLPTFATMEMGVSADSASKEMPRFCLSSVSLLSAMKPEVHIYIGIFSTLLNVNPLK